MKTWQIEAVGQGGVWTASLIVTGSPQPLASHSAPPPLQSLPEGEGAASETLHNQGRTWLGGRTGLWSKPLVLDFGGLRTTTVEFSLLAFPSLLFSSNLPGHQSPRPSLTRDPKGLLYWDGSCQLSLNLLLTQQTLNSPASSIECPQWVSFFLFRGKKDMQIILIFM